MKNKLTTEETSSLLATLKQRFEKNKQRHKGVEWTAVEKKLATHPEKLWSLNQMEITGGEPDCIGIDKKSGAFIFVDCSDESPKGRRSICYDYEALESRKEHKPKHNVIDMADEMGITVLDETQYRALQEVGHFDNKTSSWLKTPSEIRELGGAIFGDYRFGKVFIYHNGAESYYAARGFRGMLLV